MFEDDSLDDVKFDRKRAWMLFRRILHTVRDRYPILVLCLLGSVVVAGIEVGLPQLMRYAIDRYILNTQLATDVRTGSTMNLGGLYLGLLMMAATMQYTVNMTLQDVGPRSVKQIRRRVFEHLHRLPIAYFDRNPIGRLVTRVANDTGTLAELFSSVLSNLLADILKFVAIWLALFWVSPKLTACLLTMAPPLWWITRWYQSKGTRIFRKVRFYVARLNAFLQENLQGHAVIKSFTAERRMEAKFNEKNMDCYNAEMEVVYLYSTFRPVFGSASQLALVVVLLMGGSLVMTGQLTVGSFVAFVFYLKMLFAPLDDVAEKLNAFQSATVSAERIFGILDTAPEPGLGNPPTQEENLEIVFENVSFAYDPAKPVLKDVSFRIQPGWSVALVGPTGSGKTTITALLQRFYALEQGGSGRILVGRKPIQDWNVHELRSKFGTVQQDLFLFRADLQRNLTLFREAAPPQLQQALRVSRGVQVVDRYPQGLGLPLGERGQQLSQGERQLLSFARALVGDPPILILDEATASIDSVTEQAIQEALSDLLKGRTALVVAHRLSTIRQCDQILVLEHGKLIEQGTHDELLRKNGLYAQLYETQMLTSS